MPPADRTIGFQVDRWITRQKKKLDAGKIKPGTYDNYKRYIGQFRAWIGRDTPIDSIDAERLEDWHDFVSAKIKERKDDPATKAGWSKDYGKSCFGVGCNFITHVAGKNVIPLPPNIRSREMGFGSSNRKIITFSNNEVRDLVGNATGQLRLHLLLMLNCGMTQTDIADLKDNEVDWHEGRITRKRSKETDEENVPIVSYKLWPRTFELLQQYRNGGPIVLLTETGNLWTWEELGDDDEYRSSDNIASNFQHLKEKLGRRKQNPLVFGKGKSLRAFRRTSSTRIEGSRDHVRFRWLFLGHAPRDIGEKHYADHNPDLFDEAVEWLGREYGFLE